VASDAQEDCGTAMPPAVQAVSSRCVACLLVAVDKLNLLLRGAVGLMLFTMVAVVFLQIWVRFVFPKFGFVVSVPWTEELARYLMIWCIFLGAAAATRAGDLIAMDTLTTVLAPKNAWRLKLFAYLVTMAFFAFLIVVGVRWMEFGLMEYSTVMDIPMVVVYLAMPVGGILAVINISVRAWEGQQRMRQTDKTVIKEPRPC